MSCIHPSLSSLWLFALPIFFTVELYAFTFLTLLAQNTVIPKDFYKTEVVKEQNEVQL